MKNKQAKSIFSSLENYSSIPPPELWDKIEAQLDEPKKKKRAIIWWSIAASLAVGISVPGILYFNASQGNGLELNVGNNGNAVVLQKDSNEKDNGKNVNNVKSTIENSKDKENKADDLNSNSAAVPTVSSVSDSSKNNGLNQLGKNTIMKTVKYESESKAVVSNQNPASVDSKTETAMKKSAQSGNLNSLVTEENGNVSESNKSKGIAESTISKPAATIGKTALASQSNVSDKSLVGNKNSNVSGFNSNKGIAENTVSKTAAAIGKTAPVSQANASEKSLVSTQNNNAPDQKSNKGIAENTNSKDSLSKIKSEVAQLEKALAELDKDKTKKKEVPESIDKWSLQVFAGVMSSQNYNNEKALGNTVASKQSGGYGVKTNYKLNKKWGVSSGFKINELGQKIAGVSYYDTQRLYDTAPSSLPIVNNIYTPNSSTNYQLVSISKNGDYLFSSNSKSDTGLEKGDVTQNLKYFEMPLEVTYSLLSKKKTNISMNTGGFVGKLISNDITLNGSSIGENKSVNDFVYGTLLSSTVQYEFLKKTYFFIEPGMNYYINPLENQSFNQFQWMFNVGVNVKF